MSPTTRYAHSADVNIAYQVVGDGPLDLVLVPGWVSQVEAMWEEPTTRCGVQKLRRVRRRNSALPFVAVVLAARTDVAQIV